MNPVRTRWRWLWAGLLLLAGPAPRAAAPSSPIQALVMSQVAPGVYVQFGPIADWLPENGGNVANIGFVVGKRCVAVIDTGGTPEVGQRLRAAVLQATSLPVCYVINTHAHPDHVLGNVAFLPARTATDAAAGAAVSVAPRFVAHARMPTALAARERFYLNALERDFGITMAHEAVIYPTVLIDTAQDIDLGERVLQLKAWPTAHTDHDLTVLDRTTRTLFVSDLLFVGHLPVLDGRLRGWLGVMDELARMDVAIAVPGHGPASTNWPGVMQPQREYLTAVLNETRAAIKAGQTIQQAVDRVANGAAAKWQLSEAFHRRNLTAAFAELEWED